MPVADTPQPAAAGELGVRAPDKRIEEFIAAILRGAAKILGCSSANLILMNPRVAQVRVLVGTMGVEHERFSEVESLFGRALESTVFPFEQVQDSLVFASWHDRAVLETSTFAELVGNAFAEEVREQVGGLVTEERFICVPAVCGDRVLGVIIFTKHDSQPFGPQQREILLRYAQRIGEIIENDLKSRGSKLPLDGVELPAPRADASIRDQLLHFALGDTAPALLVDPALDIASCNEATTQVLGYSAEELLNQPISRLFGDSADIHAILDQQFLFHSNGYSEDISWVRHQDGRVIPARVKALLLADEGDRVIGFLVLVHDRSRVGPEADGAHAVMRRERLATMGEMAAQLAHELRNPLVSIGSTLEVLGRDPGVGPEPAATIAELAREVTRLDMILQDYLSLAARRNASVAKVELTSLVQDAGRLVARVPEAERRSIATAGPGTVEVLADYIGLRQVVVNLLRNAVEATPPGGEVRCEVVEEDGGAVIHVDDRGPGLAADMADCFQPFFTTKPNGTGLGLTVCRKIVEAHGGTISLAAREGGGCRARVLLPRKAVR